MCYCKRAVRHIQLTCANPELKPMVVGTWIICIRWSCELQEGLRVMKVSTSWEDWLPGLRCGLPNVPYSKVLGTSRTTAMQYGYASFMVGSCFRVRFSFPCMWVSCAPSVLSWTAIQCLLGKHFWLCHTLHHWGEWPFALCNRFQVGGVHDVLKFGTFIGLPQPWISFTILGLPLKQTRVDSSGRKSKVCKYLCGCA